VVTLWYMRRSFRKLRAKCGLEERGNLSEALCHVESFLKDALWNRPCSCKVVKPQLEATVERLAKLMETPFDQVQQEPGFALGTFATLRGFTNFRMSYQKLGKGTPQNSVSRFPFALDAPTLLRIAKVCFDRLGSTSC
jgi:hypothetical protein